jgi:hypothetical protein
MVRRQVTGVELEEGFAEHMGDGYYVIIQEEDIGPRSDPSSRFQNHSRKRVHRAGISEDDMRKMLAFAA